MINTVTISLDEYEELRDIKGKHEKSEIKELHGKIHSQSMEICALKHVVKTLQDDISDKLGILRLDIYEELMKYKSMFKVIPKKKVQEILYSSKIKEEMEKLYLKQYYNGLE